MTAQVYGLYDRGLIQPGLAADLVVFDPSTVAAREPERVKDLPGDCERLEQKADGIICTIVNGQVLIEDWATNQSPDRDRLLLACAHHTATHRKYGNPLDCAHRFGEAMGVARLQ